MRLSAIATDDAVIENTGVININASNSFAFSKLGDKGRLVNTGDVNFADGVTGSGITNTADRLPGFTHDRVLADGDIASAEGGVVRYDLVTTDTKGGAVNAGLLYAVGVNVSGGFTLTNEATGSISGAVTIKDGGVINNEGTITGALTANNGSAVTNHGTIAGGTLYVNAGGTLVNEAGGLIEHAGIAAIAGTMTNHGTIKTGASSAFQVWGASGHLTNASDGVIEISGTQGFIFTSDNGRIDNQGTINYDGAVTGYNGGLLLSSGASTITNSGTINKTTTTGGGIVASRANGTSATSRSLFWNQADGVMNFTGASGKAAVTMTHANTAALNDGTINV
ncbi:hypothetical protein QCK34_004545, partial [Enterobacter asburiae]|nr:hypothetical protein [Enterobacter asburiae]